ncbi:MAG: hypothetical protein U0360_06970 [Dehalococcoidia bacterium]
MRTLASRRHEGLPFTAMFIRVDIDDAAQSDEALKKQLVEVCPVDIFAIVEFRSRGNGRGHLDECTLCDLCIQAAGDRVHVVKLYRD